MTCLSLCSNLSICTGSPSKRHLLRHHQFRAWITHIHQGFWEARDRTRYIDKCLTEAPLHLSKRKFTIRTNKVIMTSTRIVLDSQTSIDFKAPKFQSSSWMMQPGLKPREVCKVVLRPCSLICLRVRTSLTRCKSLAQLCTTIRIGIGKQAPNTKNLNYATALLENVCGQQLRQGIKDLFRIGANAKISTSMQVLKKLWGPWRNKSCSSINRN